MKKDCKYYGDILYLDLNELIDIKSAMQITHVNFFEYYCSKLGIDPQVDPIMLISPLDTATLRGFLSDIINEYHNFGTKHILGI
jgi:spore maturation protein SpmB